jgi:hypothetical protein
MVYGLEEEQHFRSNPQRPSSGGRFRPATRKRLLMVCRLSADHLVGAGEKRGWRGKTRRGRINQA